MHSLSKTTSYDIDGKSDEGTWETPEFINDSMNICSFLFNSFLAVHNLTWEFSSMVGKVCMHII